MRVVHTLETPHSPRPTRRTRHTQHTQHARLLAVLVSAIALVALVAFAAGTAAAAPLASPNAEVIALDCDNGEQYTIVVNGNGQWTPGHIIEGGSGKLIPVAFSVQATDSAGNVLFSDFVTKQGKMKGVQGALVTCTFSDSFEEDGEVYTFSGTVTAHHVPR
jgi:hypothetical protein